MRNRTVILRQPTTPPPVVPSVIPWTLAILDGERRARKHAVMQQKKSRSTYLTEDTAPTVPRCGAHPLLGAFLAS